MRRRERLKAWNAVSCPDRMWYNVTRLLCQWPTLSLITTAPHLRERLDWELKCLPWLAWTTEEEKEKKLQPSQSTAPSSWLSICVSKCMDVCLVGKRIEDSWLRSPWAKARRLSIILHASMDARNCWNLFFFHKFKRERHLGWKRYTYTVKRSEYWGYNNVCMGWC